MLKRCPLSVPLFVFLAVSCGISAAESPISSLDTTTQQTDLLSAINKAEELTVRDKAFPKKTAKWESTNFSGSRSTAIYVCWENPQPKNSQERLWVQEAAVGSWDRLSALSFRGWERCRPNTRGIRIRVEDSGPHTKGLGKYLDGITDGMVLNFEFNNWGQPCKDMREDCIKSIAVHEFGHAIGFAHEQNRPDTPGECRKLAQGSDGDTTDLTPWDPNSVMNYCNKKYNNDGVLSDFDKKAVRYIYGPPNG